MSFWDNVKKFAQPYADDDYDDYDEDEEYVDEYEEPAEPVRRAPARRNRPAPQPAPIEEDEEEEDDFGYGVSTARTSAPAKAAFSGPVVNMTTGAKQEVVVFRPVCFNDTS